MACFIVPTAEAVVVTVIKKISQKREQKALDKNEGIEKSELKSKTGISWSRKLGWLNNLLWGGSLLLLIEHIWHGEVVPWPPFLTAMSTPSEISPMLHEMATTGVSMAVFVTIVWAVAVVIAEHRLKHSTLKAQKAL